MNPDNVQSLASVLSRLLDQPINTWGGAVRFKGKLVSLVLETPNPRNPNNRSLTIVVPYGVHNTKPADLYAKFPIVDGYMNKALFIRSVKLATAHLLQGLSKVESYIDVKSIEEDNARRVAEQQGLNIPPKPHPADL